MPPLFIYVCTGMVGIVDLLSRQITYNAEIALLLNTNHSLSQLRVMIWTHQTYLKLFNDG